MDFNFKIKGDRLIAGEILSGNSGNVNTYSCKFEMTGNSDFVWICVFRVGEDAYQQVIENGACAIPYEVLKNAGDMEVGCYGTKGDSRISTNWLKFKIENGAYCDATTPDEPTPDVWESLVLNTVPYIGENGNWFIFNRQLNRYEDSGRCSKGEKGDKGDRGDAGYTPKRGTDYWTEDDRNSVRKELEKDLNFEERLADFIGNSGNSLKNTLFGKSLVITDVSPIQHILSISIESGNVLKNEKYNDTSDGSSTVIGGSIILKKGKTYTISFDTEDTRTEENPKGTKLVFTPRAYTTAGTALAMAYANGTRQSITFTMTETRSNTAMSLIQRAYGETGRSGLCSSCKVEEGKTATKYTPYLDDLSMVILEEYDEQGNMVTGHSVSRDGNVVGKVLSKYPYMEFKATNVNDAAVITLEYNRDINKAFSELQEKITNAIISLGGNI